MNLRTAPLGGFKKSVARGRECVANGRLSRATLAHRQNCSAIFTALKSADALLIVSWYSEAGTESATTPAPA